MQGLLIFSFICKQGCRRNNDASLTHMIVNDDDVVVHQAHCPACVAPIESDAHFD
jgi:hypothetical protein